MPSTRFACRAALRKAARAADEREIVVALPREDVRLAHAVERANQLHAREVVAAQLGRHRLQLRAVEHGEQRRLDDVV